MNERRQDWGPAPPETGDGVADRLSSARGAAFVIAPGPAMLIGANAAGARVLGLDWPVETRLALDSAMPAIMDLRRMTARGPADSGGLMPLVFWTPEGMARLACSVTFIANQDDGPLALIEIGGREAGRDRGEAGLRDGSAAKSEPARRGDEDAAGTRMPALPDGAAEPTATPARRTNGLDASHEVARPAAANTKPVEHATASQAGARTASSPHRLQPEPRSVNSAKGRRPQRGRSVASEAGTANADLAPSKGATTHAPPRPAAPDRPAPMPAPKQAVAKPGRDAAGTKPEGPAPGAAEATAKPARLPAAPPPPAGATRSDDDTLKAIARQILAGRRGGAKPQPATSAAPLAQPNEAADRTQAAPSERTGLTAPERHASDLGAHGETTSPADAAGARNLRDSKARQSEHTAAKPDRAAQVSPEQTADDPSRGGSARRTLVRRMAHELKTPVSAIVSAAEIMKDERLGPIGDERYLRYARDIHESARHALAVIERMLGQSRPSSASSDFSFTNVDLNQIASDLISSLETLALAAGLQLTADLGKRLPLVVADATSVRQIVLNVLTNALKFTPRGGTIGLATAHLRNGILVLSVTDTGPGMSAEEIARVMSSGHAQAHAPRPGGGLGIGLPLARSLAGANGALLEIEAVETGGTRVRLAFPASRQVPV